MKKLRQKDIAAQAGVSPSTVSLLLKDPNTTRVSAETRDRIFEIIRTDRYSNGARHTQGDIVCAVPKLQSQLIEEVFYTNMLMAAEQTGQRFGYAVQLRSYTDFEVLKPLARDPGVAGIISINSSRLAEEFRSNKPVVAVNTVYTSACDVVKSNHRGSARDQVELLARHGHRRIAYFVVEFPPFNQTEGSREHHEGETERFAGYCEGLYQHHIEIRPEYYYRETLPEPTMELEEVTTRALDHFMALPQPPTAIIAYNDLYAIFLMKAAVKRGLRIPDDLSITGNDNMEMGRYSTPTLTTAEQDRSALGQVAVERLVQRIENHTQAPPQIISIPLKLIERESIAAPRS
ncbi:MAG: LacI family DNA-binding transcriptional regulator [Verrucomicrobiota bacterium]|nr:LacI family DNA-binding transcriptional regulator [Verrucomicrobiota bacterium]